MRTPATLALATAAALALHAAAPAHACPGRPPTVDTLTLLTAPGATIPADGALLVQRGHAMDHDGTGAGAAWTIRRADGAAVAVTVEALGGGVERWVLAPTARGRLEIVDASGASVGTVERTAQRGARLAGPRARALTSTITARVSRSFPGVPGGTTALTLARPAPAGVRYLAVALVDAGGYPQAAWPAAPGQQRFASTTYAHKSCAGNGVSPLVAGQRVELSWVDEFGRRSRPARATVGLGATPPGTP
ncbi:MAG: hypothetical protein R3B06_23205 [Kofleriaceae bacterium]